MKPLIKPVAAAAALCASLAYSADVVDRSGGPYVPTPPTVVDAMLNLAGVGPKDFVIDLGSGDGRIVMAAAVKHKAGGVGVDIDQELVDAANATARKQGVADRVKFLRQDVREADVSRASVVTLYLLPGMMVSLQKKLLAELKPGARVVSHDFLFDQWKPDRTISVETQEKYDMTGSWTSDVHLWVVPAPVQGAWRGKWSGKQGDDFQLEIKQGFQHFEARLARNGRTVGAKDGQMSGEVRDGETVIARWNATRVP